MRSVRFPCAPASTLTPAGWMEEWSVHLTKEGNQGCWPCKPCMGRTLPPVQEGRLPGSLASVARRWACTLTHQPPPPSPKLNCSRICSGEPWLRLPLYGRRSQSSFTSLVAGKGETPLQLASPLGGLSQCWDIRPPACYNDRIVCRGSPPL